mgnify:CR=1 FL=1
MSDLTSKDRDPNSLPARISRIMVESEERRFNQQELNARMSPLTSGLKGTFADTWSSISGVTQDTQDRLQQESMEQLMAQLPSDEARTDALKAGLQASAKWWYDKAMKAAREQHGAQASMDIVRRASARVHELREASELLDKPKNPQA